MFALAQMHAPLRFGALLALAVVGAGSARAQFGPEQLIEASGPDVDGAHAADLDGDGDLDVIACRESDPALVWYANLGGGVFGAAQPFPFLPFSAERATTIDLQGDGDQDVVAFVDYYTPELGTDPKLVVYTNLGSGNFVWFAELVNANVQAFAFEDLEGDGDLDLFYAVWTNGSIYVRVRQDSSTFASPQLLTNQANGPRDLHAADLDGDGDADLVAALYVLNQVAWYENVSGPPFGSKQILNPQADGALGVDAADLDGDGDLDVLSSSTSGNDKEVMWYENLGNDQFGDPQLITTIGYPGNDVLAVDIDGDGDLDVLPHEFFGASWYPNDGNANFGARQVISEAGVCTAVVLPDLNVDGAPDVLLASSNPGKLAWFENQVISPLGTNYCGPSVPNSTGVPGTIRAEGSPVVSVDKVRLTAGDLPHNKVGMFIASQTQGFVPNVGGGAGTLCLGGSIKRIVPTLLTGSAGSLELDLALASSLGAPVQSGQTWNFQAWHRDAGSTTNLTDGLQIVFTP